MEYNELTIKDSMLRFRKVLILTVIFNLLQMIKEIILSSLHYIHFTSFYFYLTFGLFSLFTYILTLKMKSAVVKINLILVTTLVIFYSFFFYYIEIIDFSMLIVIACFAYALHGGFIRCFIVIGFGFYILFINLVNGYYNHRGDVHQIEKILAMEYDSVILMPYLAVIWFFFVALWSIFIFWEEKNKKLEFWFSSKKLKEFGKLKSILHILMPAFVRERIRQG